MVIQFRALFRPNHGELAVNKGIILFVSLRSLIFIFESLNFVEYWRSYERLKFIQFSASFLVFSRTSHIWGYFPAISGNHWLPNRYNLVLHFPIFILIYYGSNLVKKRLSYEVLKIAQRVFNGMTKMMDDGQFQGPFLLIFNVRKQNGVFDQCQGPFMITKKCIMP